MEARIFPRATSSLAGRLRYLKPLLLVALLFCTMGASVRSRNFVVQTHDPALAQQIAQSAEKFRHDLAVSWLGRAMPDWSAPCVMTVRAGSNLGAGGSTTFMFDRGEVFGWRMSIQGSRERLFDSVLPHEITHMVLASHFRQPLPRWADEGAATSTECAAERAKHYRMLKEFLCTRRGIAFNKMFAMTEYPADVMPLYAQGFSLADYLIQQGGRRKFITFIEDGLKSRQWSAAVARHYNTADLGQLQGRWLAWVQQGHPRLAPRQAAPGAEPNIMLAQAAAPIPNRSTNAPAPSRSVRTPDRPLAAAGRRPWPQPNLIYRIPRNPNPTGDRTDLGRDQFAATGPTQGTVDPYRLVPVARPGTCGAAACPSSSLPASTQMARPQSPQPARQVILEWSKPGTMVGVPMGGQRGLMR